MYSIVRLGDQTFKINSNTGDTWLLSFDNLWLLIKAYNEHPRQNDDGTKLQGVRRTPHDPM